MVKGEDDHGRDPSGRYLRGHLLAVIAFRSKNKQAISCCSHNLVDSTEIESSLVKPGTFCNSCTALPAQVKELWTLAVKFVLAGVRGCRFCSNPLELMLSPLTSSPTGQQERVSPYA